MPRDRDIYKPSRFEPSVFCGSKSGIPVEWSSWKQHIRELGRGKTMVYPLKRCDLATYQQGNLLKERLRNELQLCPNIELPDEPPSLYAAGTDYIGLAWVLDTARRERMSPEEAYVVGQALRKMAQDEIYGRQ